MSKCQRCHRELKNHTESGMGKICQMKANKISESIQTKVRVEPLFTRLQPRRSYVVFTSPRAIVTVQDDKSGRFAICQKCSDKCQHIDAVAKADNQRFPQGH